MSPFVLVSLMIEVECLTLGHTKALIFKYILTLFQPNSGDHRQLGAGELALEEPVAEVDGQVDLVMLGNVVDILLVLHVDSHELIADLGGVFGVVHEAELLGLNVLLQVGVVVKSDSFTFDLLAPSVLVQALSEEDHVGQHDFVVVLVDAVGHAV